MKTKIEPAKGALDRGLSLPPLVMLPGHGGSGPDHWQSIWERKDPDIIRFRPASWLRPDIGDWMRALEGAIAASGRRPILVAHSLACLLVAHWAKSRDAATISGALLVAVPDPACSLFPEEASAFRDPPMAPLPFPALVLASENDPFASLWFAERTAAAWQSPMICVGELGHVNESSGIGDWPMGAMLLAAFRSAFRM